MGYLVSKSFSYCCPELLRTAALNGPEVIYSQATYLVLQMCRLLQYLCDCQVRHRIEAVVAFSDDFVACLQANQKFRYNEVMQALNMSAALTAKKTKEFRSPPQEQVGARRDSRKQGLLLLISIHNLDNTCVTMCGG